MAYPPDPLDVVIPAPEPRSRNEWDQDFPLSSENVAVMISRLEVKRKSRVWFGPDVELLDALHIAEKALTKVAGLLNVEGKR